MFRSQSERGLLYDTVNPFI